MKIKFFAYLFFACSMVARAESGMESKIDSSEAVFHVGSVAIVCGSIGEVRTFVKGVYLNMGPKYPKQHLGLLVWNDDAGKFAARFGDLSNLQGKKVCARGLIEAYKNNIQIKMTGPQVLQVYR